MKKITVMSAIIFGAVTLAGCSSKGAKLDQLSSDVQILNQRVDTLQSDVNQIRGDVDQARSEAQRANQRLDNQVITYRK